MFRRLGATSVVICSAFPAILAAQFQMPLPPHLSADSAYHIQHPFCVAVRKRLRWQADSAKAARADSAKAAPADSAKVAPADSAGFTRRLDSSDSIKVTKESCRSGHWLTVVDVFRQGDEVVRKIYGGDGVDVFTDFAATFKSDRVFLQSSIVSGMIGPVFFKASYGQFFSGAEPDEPGVTRDELRDVTGNLLRLIQNGGSAAGRAILPLIWGGGTATQQAAAIYFNAGATGPLGNTDSLQGTIGLAAEGMATFAIRNVASYELDADLFLGVRPGFQQVFGRQSLLPNTSHHTLPFVQFAGGLRVGGEPRLAALFTLVPQRYRTFVPDFQVSLQVPRP